MTPIVLAVGTTHPWNIAGLGLDLRVADRLGVRIVSVIAGVSAQDARSVRGRWALDERAIAEQFASLATVPIAAVHVGALLDARSVRAVATALAALADVPVIFDPVLAASGGDALADEAALVAMRDALFARCTLITPNVAEAAALLARPIDDVAAMEAGARELLATGSGAVLLKGGHLAGDAVDVYADAREVRAFRSPRMPFDLRGTGDLLALAIAAHLARGASTIAAIERARTFVRDALRGGVDLGGVRTMS